VPLTATGWFWRLGTVPATATDWILQDSGARVLVTSFPGAAGSHLEAVAGRLPVDQGCLIFPLSGRRPPIAVLIAWAAVWTCCRKLYMLAMNLQ
jgi:hypothetical protein